MPVEGESAGRKCVDMGRMDGRAEGTEPIAAYIVVNDKKHVRSIRRFHMLLRPGLSGTRLMVGRSWALYYSPSVAGRGEQ